MNKRIEFETERIQKSIPTREFIERYVDIPKFLGACRECHNYKNVWSCPEYSFDPMDVWKDHETLDLVLLKFTFSEDDRSFEGNKEEIFGAVRGMLREQKNMLLERMLEFEKDTQGSLALSAGSCDLCGFNGDEHICARKQGKDCLHPDKMRYSVESLGGDVVGVARDLFDVELKWSDGTNLPEYYILMCGLLK